jgi:hypothetical protein
MVSFQASPIDIPPSCKGDILSFMSIQCRREGVSYLSPAVGLRILNFASEVGGSLGGLKSDMSDDSLIENWRMEECDNSLEDGGQKRFTTSKLYTSRIRARSRSIGSGRKIRKREQLAGS